MATVGSRRGARVDPRVVCGLAGLAVALGGCAAEAVFQRASNEFACPRQRIEVVDRGDIAEGLYDVDACGARARYMCIDNESTAVPVQCVREPDPARWDPDPVQVASLPRPSGMPDDGRVARLCPRDDRRQADDCLRMEAGGWRWVHHPPAVGGGLGMTGQ
ncbi:MAG TPA: hypothetical protein VKZ18_21195 [Polyangia bacterium]|nr:hypothetical protein [Polyangia bacterium]